MADFKPYKVNSLPTSNIDVNGVYYLNNNDGTFDICIRNQQNTTWLRHRSSGEIPDPDEEIFPTTDFSDAKIALMLNDSGDTFMDISGNENNASAINISKVAEGVEFDGSSYIDLPNIPNLKTLVIAQNIPISARGFLFRGLAGGSQIAINYTNDLGTVFSVSKIKSNGRLVDSSNGSKIKDGWKIVSVQLDSDATTNYRIGGNNTNLTNLLTEGKIAAIVGYDKVLNETELSAVHNSLYDAIKGRSEEIKDSTSKINIPLLISKVATVDADFLRDKVPTPYTGELDENGRDKGNFNVHPSILDIKEEKQRLGLTGDDLFGYRYWMAFTPYPGFAVATENPCIVVSNDKQNWSVLQDVTNPIFGQDAVPGGGYNADPALALDPDGVTLHLIWQAASGTTIYRMHSSSSDGFKTNTGANQLYSVQTVLGEHEVSPSFFYDTNHSKWFMWCTLLRYDSPTNLEYNTLIRREATNPNGNWSNPIICNLPEFYSLTFGRGPWHGEVRPDNRVANNSSSGYIYCCGITNSGKSSTAHHGFILTSNNGVDFYSSAAPFFIPTVNEYDKWYNGSIYKPSIINTPTGWEVIAGIRAGDTGDVDNSKSEFKLGWMQLENVF